MAEYYSTAKCTDLERLMAKVYVHPSGCWWWTDNLCRGYGSFYFKGTTYKAYKASYILHKGPVPEGLVIDHTCHDPRWCDGGWTCPHRRCVNPDHLKAVTHKENTSPERACTGVHWKGVINSANARKAKTHCKRGHSYIPENTRYRTDIRGYVYRYCQLCEMDSRKRRSATYRLKNQYSSTPNVVA